MSTSQSSEGKNPLIPLQPSSRDLTAWDVKNIRDLMATDYQIPPLDEDQLPYFHMRCYHCQRLFGIGYVMIDPDSGRVTCVLCPPEESLSEEMKRARRGLLYLLEMQAEDWTADP